MLNHLGANISYKALKVSLDKKNVLGIPVFVTLDACHLIKLVRNAFGTLKVIKDMNGDTFASKKMSLITTKDSSANLQSILKANKRKGKLLYVPIVLYCIVLYCIVLYLIP